MLYLDLEVLYTESKHKSELPEHRGGFVAGN